MIAVILSMVLAGSVPDTTGLREHAIEVIKENVQNSDAGEFISSINQDGSWDDLDYKDDHRGAWPANSHASRIMYISAQWLEDHQDKTLEAARKALDWWLENNPINPNWWFNEIAVPMELGKAAIMLGDRLTDEEKAGVMKIMHRAKLTATGQNKIWYAQNVLLGALIEDDLSLVKQARDSIVSEIRFSDGEGLKQDWSFHQHGPQYQIGNYGLSYASDMAWWAKAFRGTFLELTEEQENLIRNYISEGLLPLVWKGYFDFSGCGRQLEKDLQRSKAASAMKSARLMGIAEEATAGPRYYPCSDFGVYRTDSWYASVRMQSERTKGFETTNDENMKGYFTADGALLVRRDGDEYNDVAPILNWHHIPGTTTWDDGKELWGDDGSRNDTPLVFGRVMDGDMVVAMDYNRGPLRARKAWFFHKKGIVCIGCGIETDSTYQVVTTLEQCRLKDKPKFRKRWSSHNGITYTLLDGSSYTAAPEEHSGMWSYIAPFYDDTPVEGKLFEIYIDHGKAPQGESYAYAVTPDGSRGAKASRWVRRHVRIMENSTSVQKVVIDGREYSIDWNTATIR